MCPQRFFLGGEATILTWLCLGIFAAADALGVGFVHGIPPHLYLENIDEKILKELELSLLDGQDRPDVYLRVPAHPESVFRGVIEKERLPISDIFQVWLDVSNFPARGKAQAEEIRKRILKPLLLGDRR